MVKEIWTAEVKRKKNQIYWSKIFLIENMDTFM